jgi:hypothetical protein
MGKNKKKPYEKPKLTRIKLDAQCAVLGFCKAMGGIGRRGANCGLPMLQCSAVGS